MAITHQIAIEAQILDTTMGGVSSHLAALVKALGELDGPERYLVVCAQENPDWLRPYLGPNQKIVLGPQRRSRQLVRHLFGKYWQRVWVNGYTLISRMPVKVFPVLKTPLGAITNMRGYYESLGASLVQVFYQAYIQTALPVIFNPHDLQHEHFPEFFTPQVLARRRILYRTACEKATVVVAASQYTKQDVIRCYNIPSQKIVVIPMAAATTVHQPVAVEDVEATLAKYSINTPFIFYPAVTWEHKNHLRLLQAVLRLREQGAKVTLVCTGRQLKPMWSKLIALIQEYRMEDQVKFLGFVPGHDLRALYKSCQFVIAPSLFEQASGPMFEAWQEGTAVASSNVTSIPEQAGNAALLFNPLSVDEIANAILVLWNDSERRYNLARLGQARLKEFSWQKTAKAYRALYRCVGRWAMTEEDREILGTDWMTNTRNPDIAKILHSAI